MHARVVLGVGKGVLFREVSSSEVEMHAVGVGKGVLFREVFSVQMCPYREVPIVHKWLN